MTESRDACPRIAPPLLPPPPRAPMMNETGEGYYCCPDLRFAASSFAAASILLPAAWKAAFSCGACQHG